jgi:hypothetical protein
MFTIGYFVGTERVGLLAWAEPQGSPPQAIGGIAPPEGSAVTSTVVSRDNGETTYPGCVHPDDLV